MGRQSWRAIWTEDGKLLSKRFWGDKPTNAVTFAKDLKRRGISVDVVSVMKAFPPPIGKLRPDRPGLLWCPYCIKWREFVEAEVKTKEFMTPSLLRCPTCTISVKDAYVRGFNPEVVIRYELQQEMRAKNKEAAKLKKKNSISGGMKRRRR